MVYPVALRRAVVVSGKKVDELLGGESERPRFPELEGIDAEVCDTCDDGIMYLRTIDGLRCCRNCVYELARERNWDKLPDKFFRR